MFLACLPVSRTSAATSSSRLVQHKQRDGTIVQPWRMLARNTMNPSSGEIELFLLEKDKHAIMTKEA